MKPQSRITITSILLAMSCFGALAVAQDNLQASATYSIPEEAEFAGFGTFELEVTQWQQTEEFFIFEYVLPADLVGRENDTMFMIGQKNPDGPFFELFCGETDSFAHCAQANASTACSIKFGELNIDQATLEAHLLSRYPADEAAKRLKAAKVFARDAIGTLVIRGTAEVIEN